MAAPMLDQLLKLASHVSSAAGQAGTLPIALALLWLLWPALRGAGESRFFAVATLLCLAPLRCTLPSARVLLGLVGAVQPARDVIVVQALVELLSNYAMLELTRVDAKARVPRTLQLLNCGVAEVSAERLEPLSFLTALRRGS